MPNFDTGNLLTAQTIVADKYKGSEMRMKPAPAFTLLSSNDNHLIQSAESLKTRDDRAIEVHLLARTKRTAGSARAFNHTGTLDDSQKVTLSWTIKSDKFAMSLKLLNKSVHDFNTVFANKLEQACMNILEDKETEAIAYLMAQRSTTSPTLKGATYNTGVPKAAEIALADEAKFFQIIRSVMRQNYFAGPFDVVADSLKAISAEFLGAQGQGNATNYGYQFNGLNVAESIELTDADYAKGCALVMPAGQVCALNWIPKENRQGWGDFYSTVGGYSTFSYRGFQFALHGYSTAADTSATNGDTQDVTMQFELSLDSSFNKAPLTTIAGRTDSVIIEFGQLAV